MPSPLAHAGAALALQVALTRPRSAGQDRPSARWDWRVTLVAAFASVAPDFDIVVALLIPDGLDWHRGPSHSLIGAALIGAACAATGRLRGWAAWATTVGAAVLHVPFDWSTGEPGAPSRYGVPLAWPLSDEKFLDARPWFGAFRIDEAGFLSNMWAPHALPVYLGELATVLALVTVGFGVRTLRKRLRATRKPAEEADPEGASTRS